MSDYKNYQLRQLGLTKESLKSKHPVKEMLSPTAKNGVIAIGVRGSSTGGFPSGIDQTGIPSETPTGRLGGYEPIPDTKDNSEVVDKTPNNPEINSANPISDTSNTSQTPHAHQIQQATDQAPQTVTGASTDSDSTLTLKSAMPKSQPTIDIDVAEEEKEPNDMDGQESMEDEDKAKAGLQEGKHKAGCKCGFCANKGKMGKKKEVAEEHGDDDYGQDPDSKDTHDKQFRKDRSASSAGDNVRKSFEKDKTDDKDLIVDKEKSDKKFGMDETFKRHLQLMKESIVKDSDCQSDSIKEVNYTKDSNGKDVIAVGAPGSQARWETENPDKCFKCKEKKPCQCANKVNEDKLPQHIRNAILAKDKNHKWGNDGFCMHGCKMHKTDITRQNDLCPKLMNQHGIEVNESKTKYSSPFEKMRGLANLGERKVMSNGLWESTQVNEKDSGKWMQDVSKNAEKNHTKGALHKDLGISEKEKIPTERLKSVQARLHAKSESGELSEKELTLSRRINAALNMRKESMDETFNRHKNLALGK